MQVLGIRPSQAPILKNPSTKGKVSRSTTKRAKNNGHYRIVENFGKRVVELNLRARTDAPLVNVPLERAAALYALMAEQLLDDAIQEQPQQVFPVIADHFVLPGGKHVSWRTIDPSHAEYRKAHPPRVYKQLRGSATSTM